MTSSKQDVNVLDLGKDLSSLVSGLVRWWCRWFDLWVDLTVVLLVQSWLGLALDGAQWALIPAWPAASAELVTLLTLLVALMVWRRRGPLQGWYGPWRLRREKGRERSTFARVVRDREIKGSDGLLGVGDPYPRLRVDGILDGVTVGLVKLPPGLPGGMEWFLKQRDTIEGAYPDHPRYGPVERLYLSRASTNGSREASFTLIRTPLRLPPPLEDVAPAAAQSYRLGRGFRGEVRWDVVDDPHASINGPTRSGKGNIARCIALQALHAGQRVDVIDGTGSHEWSPLLAYEGLFRWRPYEANDVSFYVWADTVLDDLGAEMVARNRAIGERGFDNFTAMVKAGRAAGMRRRLLIIDEASTTLTTASPDKRVKDLVGSVAGKVDAVAKTAAKAGGHLIVVDQLPYQGQAGLASATRAQLGRWVATGPVPNEMKPGVSGLQSWPFDTPEGRGFAATGRRGLSAELLVVPQVGREAVRS